MSRCKRERERASEIAIGGGGGSDMESAASFCLSQGSRVLLQVVCEAGISQESFNGSLHFRAFTFTFTDPLSLNPPPSPPPAAPSCPSCRTALS